MAQENLHPMNRSSSAHLVEHYDDLEALAKELGFDPRHQPRREDVPNAPKFDLINDLVNAGATKRTAHNLHKDNATWVNFHYAGDIEAKPWLRRFEPRRIVPPGGYLTPKGVSCALYSTLSEVVLRNILGQQVLPTQVTAMMICYQILKYSVPTYYVSEALLRAVAATEVPKDYIIGELKWPMPAMVLGLPQKFIKEYTGREVNYVYAADFEKGEYPPPSWLRDVTVPIMGIDAPFILPPIVGPSKIGFWYNTWSAKDYLQEMFVTSWFKKDRIADTTSKYGYTDYTDSPKEKSDSDQEVAEKIGSLLLKLLAVLNARPALLKQASITRPHKVNARTGKVEQTELWKPNMIGEGYQILRKAAPAGTHASPNWHWRHGHWVMQSFGSPKSPEFVAVTTLPRTEDGEIDWNQVDDETKRKFWSCHRRLYLDAFLVNFDEEEDKPAA